MTFNDNADISSGKVGRRGRTALIAGGGGGGLLVVGLIILSQVLGVDLTGLAGGGAQQGSDSGVVESLDRCQSGEQANTDLDCRMKGAAAAIDTYWTDEVASIGVEYHSPKFALFSDATSTACGSASSATGPFYCPGDETLYVDTAFFDELRTRFGSSGGSLAQMYVVAHEWGHHIQKPGGALERAQDGGTGPASAGLRVELHADCFAGAWVGSASKTKDENGVPFLKPVSDQQIRDALSAASAVGDDRIQAASGGLVNPETWTHGSSEQRQRWFLNGYREGATACNTFSVGADTL